MDEKLEEALSKVVYEFDAMTHAVAALAGADASIGDLIPRLYMVNENAEEKVSFEDLLSHCDTIERMVQEAHFFIDKAHHERLWRERIANRIRELMEEED